MELNELFFEIHNDMPRQGPGRNRYTRQAFEMLPALDTPRILDIGCGPGQPTIEVAWIRPDPPREVFEYWKAAYPAIAPINDNIEIIERAGYRLLGHFPLPEDAWWHAYYGPLEKRIADLRVKYADDPEALAQLEEELVEIEMFRKYNRWYGSVFFVMQRAE